MPKKTAKPVLEDAREKALRKIAAKFENRLKTLLAPARANSVVLEPGDRVNLQVTCSVDGVIVVSTVKVLKHLRSQNTNISPETWERVLVVPWVDPWKTVLSALRDRGNKPLSNEEITVLIQRPLGLNEHLKFNSIVIGLGIPVRMKPNKPASNSHAWDKKTFNLVCK